MKKPRLQSFSAAVDTQRERLMDSRPVWFPFPILIPFMLACALIGIVLSTFNYRRGMAAILPQLQAEQPSEASIWLAISLKDDALLITTQERQHIVLPRKISSAEDLAPFKKFLNDTAERLFFNATLARRISSEEITVIFAVDEQLRYAHIRPLIQTIAELGITNYGFETQNTVVSEKDSEPSESSGQDAHM